MQNKLKFVLLLLLVNVFLYSCSKNDSPPVTPPAPELFDTLGTGWQRIKIDTMKDLEDVFFVNNQTGFLCGKYFLAKSVDGGLTWKSVIPDSLKGNFINLYFADINNGWVFGDANFFLRTHDGGASWKKINRGSLYDGQFFDANNGYVLSSTSGSPRGLYKTSDGGDSFQFLSAGSGSNATSSLFFLNINKGWFSDTYLHKTENAGQSFSNTSGPLIEGYAMQFTDDMHGWMTGFGKVFRTTNGGDVLTNIIPAGFSGGADIYFSDNNNGFILAGSSIYSTADGGTTLQKLCAIHKSSLYEIHFTDLNHGWATGNGGYVYRYVKP